MVSAAAHLRVARLASLTPVHRAFHWLHLHQPQMRVWQMQMLAIPAPSFDEARRAAWFLERFTELGLTHVHLDEAGNAIAEFRPEASDATEAADGSGERCLLISAHLDTVFPQGTPSVPSSEGTKILCPGACDNAAGLTALLGVAAALRFARIVPRVPIIFAANVGEEGEGDLLGMRQIFLKGEYRGRIAAAIALEGSGTNAVVTRALGSRRFRVTVTGPGGHSWSDSGTPNPILILSRALLRLSELALPGAPRTTLNVGGISGGTSVNSVPATASALLDLRSTDEAQLQATEVDLRAVLELVAHESRVASPLVSMTVETIGDRPAASLPESSPLLSTVRAVDRHLALRTEVRLGSTDANLPLSMGIPAIAVGAGGSGGRIHTVEEWYDPTGRETALRRIVLTLLDTVDWLGEA